MKASVAFPFIAILANVILGPLFITSSYAGYKLRYLDATLPDDKSPRSFEKLIINGIELSAGSVFLGMSFDDVKNALQKDGYVDASTTDRAFDRAVTVNGEDYRVRAKGGSRYTAHGTQSGIDDEFEVFFTPGVERVFEIVRTIRYSDAARMPRTDDVISQVRAKYGPGDPHGHIACRSFSATQRFDAGECWAPDNFGSFSAAPMLAKDVHSYIQINATKDSNASDKTNFIQFYLFSAELAAEADDLWDKTVKEAIANIPPPADPFSFSEKAPQSQEENSNAKLAALVMFGADVEKKVANPMKDGVIILGEWINTSENPLIFHNVQDDQEMVVEEINECTYKADVNVRKPNDLGQNNARPYRYVQVIDFSKVNNLTVGNPLAYFTIQGRGKDPKCRKYYDPDGQTRFTCDFANPDPDGFFLELDGGANDQNVWNGIMNFFGSVCKKELHRARW